MQTAALPLGYLAILRRVGGPLRRARQGWALACGRVTTPPGYLIYPSFLMGQDGFEPSTPTLTATAPPTAQKRKVTERYLFQSFDQTMGQDGFEPSTPTL